MPTNLNFTEEINKADGKTFMCFDLLKYLIGTEEEVYWKLWNQAKSGNCCFSYICKRYEKSKAKKKQLSLFN
jgi:hypothetical protein